MLLCLSSAELHGPFMVFQISPVILSGSGIPPARPAEGTTTSRTATRIRIDGVRMNSCLDIATLLFTIRWVINQWIIRQPVPAVFHDTIIHPAGERGLTPLFHLTAISRVG